MTTKYQAIYADPPWQYDEGFPTQSRSPGKWEGPVTNKALPYPSMTLKDIKALNVNGIAAKDCRLFLWATNKYLPDAFIVMRAWGFEYKQTLVWHKSDGNMGGSIAPNSAEYLIVGIKGKPRRLSKLKSAVHKYPQSKRHSKKPEDFRRMIEETTGGPYLELFARKATEGWDVWGDEVERTAELDGAL